MNAKSRPVLPLVFLIVFLDIVGFSIVFPLFPAMLEHYVAIEGTDSLVGELVAWLEGLADSERHAVVTLFGGVLGSIYSLLQFLFAPVWGGLSDRIGRRPTLLITITGTFLSYVLWIFAGSFALLVGARILGGIMAGNISTATAVVADTTKAEKRAGGMGIVGMAVGLGFILGPALGGIASLAAPGGEAGWQRGFALNPFSLPAMVACGIAAINLVWVIARLPETRPAEGPQEPRRRGSLNPLRQMRRLDFAGVWNTTLIFFLYTSAFSAMEFTLTFLAVERFTFTPRDNMWMFVFIGLVIAVVQGGFVRRLAPRLGEKRLILGGIGLLVPGFFVIAWAPGTTSFYGGLFLLSVGSALAMPCLSSLVSRYTPDDRQGSVLGHFRSAGALARAVGPIVGGILYWQLGSASPYWLGGAFLLVPLVLAGRLPAPPSAPVAEAAEPA